MLKFKLFLGAAFLFITFHLFAQEEIKMESKVVSATVFSESAIITREARANIPSTGEYKLVFANLKNIFHEGTVKISGKGSAKIKIIDVKTERKFTSEISNELVKREQAKIDSLRLLDQIVSDKIAVLQSQKNFIESLKAESAKQVNEKTAAVKPSIQDWQSMVQFFSKNLSEVYDELRSENIKKKKLAEQIKTIEDNIRNQRTGHDKSYSEIHVTVLSEQSGSLTLQASYLVEGASWTPVYDARVFTENKNLELSYFGMIKQNTGEDWKNINLTLSTAKPMFNFVFPTLKPYYLGINDNIRYNNSINQVVIRGIENGKSTAAQSSSQPSEAIKPLPGRLDANEYVVEFDRFNNKDKSVFTKFVISSKANIPSDNSPHKVHIDTRPMDIAEEYKAVPKLIPGTFLSCKAANKNNMSLVAGQMSVYLGDDFVNKFDIANVSPGDTFNLSLGIDEAIKTERKMINKFLENKGLFGGKKSVTYEYEITVTNNKQNEQDIILVDQLPISQNEEITVDLLYPKESELVMDNQKIITWNLKLKSGEKKVIPLKYSVIFPDYINVVDLE